MKECRPSVPLLAHQVCDAFCAAYEGTDTTREERERLFREWLRRGVRGPYTVSLTAARDGTGSTRTARTRTWKSS